MSKWLEELPNGEYKEELANADECAHMYNEICCNADCDMRADFPSKEDCECCKYFEKEK